MPFVTDFARSDGRLLVLVVPFFKVDRHFITVTGVRENMLRKGLGIVQRRSSFQHSVWPACYSLPIRALSVPVLPVPCSHLGSLSLPHAAGHLPRAQSSAYASSQPHPVKSRGECTP